MSDCIPAAELAVLAGLPEADPRRRHVEACARCRAAWLEYRDFIDSGAVAGLVSQAPDPAVRATLDRAIAAACTPPRRRAVPGLRLLVPLAAAAVLAFAYLVLPDQPGPTSPPAPGVLRGGTAPAAPPLHPPRTLPDGTLELRWGTLAAAGSYHLRFLGTNGALLGETSPQADTTFIVHPETLPAGLPTTGMVAWRVVAATPSGEVVSAPGLFPVPTGH
jgi:hypothetical protein